MCLKLQPGIMFEKTLKSSYILLICLVLQTIIIVEVAATIPSTTIEPGRLRNLTGEHWKLLVHACGSECRDGEAIENGYCSNISCYPCDCDESCASLGTCCPTYHQDSDSYSYPYGTASSNTSRWLSLLNCSQPMFGQGRKYLSAVRCPDSWEDENVRNQCELSSLPESIDSVLPFSDEDTGLVFKNVHCAICNGFHPQLNREPESQQEDQTVRNAHVKIAVPWELRIECIHFQRLYHFIDMLEFANSAESSNLCEVKLVEPNTTTTTTASTRLVSRRPRRCPDTFIDLSVPETTCKSSREVHDLCKKLPPLPSLMTKGYKNLFCAMCNDTEIVVMDYDWLMCSLIAPVSSSSAVTIVLNTTFNFNKTTNIELPPIIMGKDTLDYAPMSILFSPHSPLRESGERFPSDCPPGHRRHVGRGNCTKIVCSPGKVLDVDNVTCTTAISHVAALGYNLNLVFRPLIGASSQDAQEIYLAILERTWKCLGGHQELSSSFIIRNCSKSERENDRERNKDSENGRSFTEVNATIVEITVSGYVFAPANVSRDTYEEGMEQCVLANLWELNIYDGIYANKTLPLQVIAVGQEMVQLYEATVGPENYAYVSEFNQTSNCVLEKISVGLEKDQMPGPDIIYYNLIKQDSDIFIDVTPTLNCPYLQLETTANLVPGLTKSKTLSFIVAVESVNISIAQDTGVSLWNGTLSLCVQKYDALLSKSFSDDDSLHIGDIVYYSEIVCTAVSVMCLAVTFATYCILPSMRTLPGLNNVSLCFSLATAQTSLLVTALLGIEGKLSGLHCLVNGFIVHYSWLAKFCWLNSCCLHMFRVFMGSRGSRPVSDMKAHLLYCIYSFGIPVLIVGVTVGLTYLVTGGDSLGYSDQICFLDTAVSSLLVIFPLLVPFGVAMIANGTLFTITITKIFCRKRHQRDQKTTRSQDVASYLRLSTVTGLFFVLEAVAVLMEEPIFMLVAAPLVALQGLFIFFSFIVNKTVWNLYKERFACKHSLLETTGSSSQNSKGSTT